MKIVINNLTSNSVYVFTVTKPLSKLLLHDKLILIEYGTKTVIIDSIGFTTYTQDNLNFENMVSINDNYL